MSDSALHALAGSAGGCAAMVLTYPLVNISTRAAVSVNRSSQKQDVKLSETFNKENIANVYSGLGSSLIGIAATNGIYYACYEKLRSVMLRSRGSDSVALSTSEGIVAGLVAGSITTLATNPIWTIQAAQATETVSATGTTKALESSAVGTAQRIYRRDGLSGFWRGTIPALILVVNPVIQYTSFERMLGLLLAYRSVRRGTASKTLGRSSLSDWDLFMLGAASKLLATGTTYPIIVIKSRLQAATHKYASLFKALLQVLREEGLEGLYAGAIPKLIQSVLTAAFMFVAQRRVYDALKRATSRLVVA